MLTVPIPCSGPRLLVTVDFAPEAGGSLRVNGSTPLTSNATDSPVAGLDFSAYIGKEVVLELELRACSVYTIGWAVQ